MRKVVENHKTIVYTDKTKLIASIAQFVICSQGMIILLDIAFDKR